MRQPNNSKYVPALGFRWLTPYYDAVVGATTRERTFKHALIEQANIEAGQRVLDLGCGTGTLSIWIKKAHREADVLGVDGDSAVLSLAAHKAKQADALVWFYEAMSYDLPFPDAHFDRVVSSLFFHHLSWDDKERTGREIYRVLRPGAQLHIADWGKSTNILMRGLFLSIQLLDGFRNTQDNVTGKLVELFEHAGFIGTSQNRTFSTVFGTVSLYSSIKPD